MNVDYFRELKKILLFVWENKKSDFYRNKFIKHNFNPSLDFNFIEDFKKVPLITKNDLSEASSLNLLFLEEKDVRFISSTSGTTGEPTLIFKSEQINHLYSGLNLGRTIFLQNPIRNCQFYNNFAGFNNKIIAVGNIHNLSLSCRIILELKIEVIQTTPSLAVLLLDYIELNPGIKENLRHFVLSGERMTPQKKDFLKKLYPFIHSFFVNYGIAEIGLVAFQCSELAKRDDGIYFHPIYDYRYFELLDADNNDVGIGDIGELVITNFNNLATPMIRYKTGDLAKFIKNDCPCGATGSLLEILGRINNDVATIGGVVIRSKSIENLILKLGNYLENNFECHLFEDLSGFKIKININLKVSLKEGIKEDVKLKEIIRNEFLDNFLVSPNHNLRKAIAIGILNSFEIIFTELSELNSEKRLFVHY